MGLLIATVSFLYPKLSQKNDSYQKDNAETERLRQIKELTVSSKQGVPDEKTANEVQRRLCHLTARTIEEQSKAVEAVREFISNPKAEVVYQCNDSFYNLEQGKLVQARSETYVVGINTFQVNPNTNHVIQANLKEPITSGAPTSSTQAESKVKEFIANHPLSLGTIDLSKLKFESNSKSTNRFFTWVGETQKIKLDPPSETCSKDIAKNVPNIYYKEDGAPCYKNYESNVTPIIQVAINNQGQILNYSNTFEGEIGREITL